jgi:hypothetical protein
MPNPYNYSTVVTDPDRFFGRGAVLEDLCTRLRNMQSTSIVGLRRIGKSSLLYQLAHTLPDRLGQNYVPIYIDLQDARYRTVADLVKTVAMRLNQSMGGVSDVQAADTSSQQDASRRNYLVRLRQILDTSFDEGDLRTVCFDLGVDYENLPGEGKANKARELVIHLERCGRIPELVEIGVQRRPNVSWEHIPEASRGILSAFQNAPLEQVREMFKARRLRGKLTVGSVTDMASFSEMLHNLDHTGVRPVLCLDEFEEFMRHPDEFDDDFLEALRSLGGLSKLAMITASRTPLVELVRAGRLTSPFYNIFSQIELGLIEYDAARALRRVPFVRDGIPLSAEHEALVEELGGRHPFFLQMACYHLYDALFSPQGEWADRVRQYFNYDAKAQFERLWGQMRADERVALKVVIGQGVPVKETKETLKRLARLGLVEQKDGEWRPFSQAFAERLRQYLIPERRRNVLERLRDIVRPS